MQTVALSWLALVLSNSPLQVGLVTTAGAAPVLLFTLYGGMIADRVNRRRALLILQALLLLEALALGLLTALGLITMPLVYVLAASAGLISAFEIPIRQSWLVELVGKGDLMNAIALNSTAFNLSRVIGPAIAGTLIATLGTAACFFLNAASFLAVLIGLFLITPDPALRRGGQSKARLKDGIAHVLGNPWPKALVILTAVLNTFGSSFIAILPVYARYVLRAGAGGYGALMSFFGLGAAASAISIAAVGHQFRRERTAVTAGIAMGASLVVLSFVHVLGFALVLMLCAGLSLASTAIMTNTLLQTEAPDHLRGQVMGFYSFIVVGMAPFGSLQAGWIAEHAGTGVALQLGGGICLVVASAIAWRMLRRPPAVPSPAGQGEVP